MSQNHFRTLFIESVLYFSLACVTNHNETISYNVRNLKLILDKIDQYLYVPISNNLFELLQQQIA